MSAETTQSVPFDEWCRQLDAYHERQRRTGVFEGYGAGSVVKKTGAECWRDYYDDGWLPEEALEEDRSYWE